MFLLRVIFKFFTKFRRNLNIKMNNDENNNTEEAVNLNGKSYTIQTLEIAVLIFSLAINYFFIIFLNI